MENNQKNQTLVLLLTVGLVATLFLNFRVSSKVNDLEREVRYMENNIVNEINDLERSLSNELYDFMEEQNNKIADMSYELVSFDAGKMEAVYDIRVQVKEAQNNSDIKWLYEGVESGVKDAVLLKSEGNLLYKGSLSLSINDNYNTNLVAVSETGQELLTSAPLDLYLKSDYMDHRASHISGSGSYGSKSFAEETLYEIKLLDEDRFGLEKIEMQVHVDDEIRLTKDVTAEVVIGKDADQVMETLRSQNDYESDSSHHRAFSESSMTVSMENYEEENNVFATSYMGHYYFGEYQNLGDASDDSNIYITYKFTYKDGYLEDSFYK